MNALLSCPALLGNTQNRSSAYKPLRETPPASASGLILHRSFLLPLSVTLPLGSPLLPPYAKRWPASELCACCALLHTRPPFLTRSAFLLLLSQRMSSLGTPPGASRVIPATYPTSLWLPALFLHYTLLGTYH